MNKNLVFFIILVIAPCCFGQKTKQSKYVLNQSLPSVYITYVKTDERVIFDDVKKSFAWFRFHNNMRWKIVLNAGGGFGQDDATLFYDILDENNKITENTYCHACSILWLSGGKSILFSVPAEYLKKSEFMRIRYNYEWEELAFSSSEKEPIHYVYFETPSLLKQ